MDKTISQRELRNDSGQIMRAVEAGESFIVTRNGVPLAALTPLKRRTSVPREEVLAAFRGLPRMEFARFRADADAVVDPWVEQVPGHVQGLLDTSVVIDLDVLAPDLLPMSVLISAVTLAELSQGPHATEDSVERTVRQDRLQRTEGLFDVLPFDVDAARAHGRIYAAVRAAGRQPRRRTIDLFIAAVALANGLPLYTRNPDDFVGLESLIDVVAV